MKQINDNEYFIEYIMDFKELDNFLQENKSLTVKEYTPLIPVKEFIHSWLVDLKSKCRVEIYKKNTQVMVLELSSLTEPHLYYLKN